MMTMLLLVAVLFVAVGVKAGAELLCIFQPGRQNLSHPCPWQSCRGLSYIKCNNQKSLKVSWPLPLFTLSPKPYKL